MMMTTQMIDHAPRIRAEQQAAKDEAAMAELERRSAPLLWACMLAALILGLGVAADAVDAHLARVAELAAQGEAFAQCLNGRTYQIDNVIVTCEAKTLRPLVAGLGGVR